jgi:acyl-CoA dehydrogenase
MTTVPTLEEFTREAEEFLSSRLERRVVEAFEWGRGSDNVALFDERGPREELMQVEAARAWRRLKYDNGFGWISGPAEYGGRALPTAYERAFAGLEARYELPDQSLFRVGLGMVAPTMLVHATEELRALYLPKLFRADVVCCQLFSEPGAGSDLASLSTHAERDGDEWVVNGQKVWTSGAHYSDIGELICRTDRSQRKHGGISAFLLDMHAPGVEVRPLRQMTGGASFNEVFFTDVRVPDSHRLGAVNEGWKVAVTTLLNERASVGVERAGSGRGVAGTARHLATAHQFGRNADPILRQELADLHGRYQIAKYTARRAAASARSGQPPGPEMSTAKLTLTQNLTASAELAGRALGVALQADTGEWGTFAWTQLLLGSPGMRIGGGTDEIQRNIIGERVLGLPKEPGAAS